MGHTYSNLLVHVVFSTKGRTATILPSFLDRLREYMAGIARNEFGRAIKIGGTQNHLHALLSIDPAIAVAEAMRKWKSLSSGWLHEEIADAAGFTWQEGYGAFSVSQSQTAKVIAYIDKQEEHHKTQTFEEEFLGFLKRHGVAYDPQRVWA